jgi:HEAT repeat protein
MMIHFRCRRCRNAVSVGARQAGCPMLCTVCKGEIVVPSASEIAPPSEPGTLVPGARLAAVSSPPVAHAPGSPQKANKHPRRRMGRRALIAVSVGVLVLVAAGWMTNRVWSKWRQPATQDVALLEENESDDALADVDLPPAPSAAEDRQDIAAPEGRLASGLKEEEETVQGEWSKMPARPAKAEGAKSESRTSSGNLVVKRRREFSEEELRKQLLWAPEVGLTQTDVRSTFAAYQKHLDSAKDWEPFTGIPREPCREPTIVLAQRPDLKTLPYRRGGANRLDRNSTAELFFLGQELHVLLDRLATKGEEGRSSAVLLGEFMKLESLPDKKPTWLRPAAVPTLQQILGHEDLAIRLLLVNLLTQIDGRAASLALVQHAVFDLSAQVRDAAIEGLDGRPREQYRSALAAALRYPWPPAADHAAEAFVALKDRDAAPLLVRLLMEPDPSTPVVKKDQLWKSEVVRLNHLANCMACHPPGEMPPYYPGSGPSLSESVRADVTFLRQDFSIQQPVRRELGGQSVNLRFDYIVRFRPLTEKQKHEWKAQATRPESHEQREAVLFALRELTGQDAGPTTEAWEKLYPTSEFEQWTTKLTMALVDAPDYQKLTLIKKLREAKGVAYTEALAQAIPQLAEVYQPKARAALVERMKRMSRATLRDKLTSESREIRLAAATVVGLKEETALLPDLKALLDDPEPEVAEAAQAALKSLKVSEAKVGDRAE